MTIHYWNQFKRNAAAVLNLVHLIVIFVVGTVGPMRLEPPTLDH